MPESRHITILRDFLELPLEQLFAELLTNGFARDRLGIPLQKKVAELLAHLPPDTSVEEFKFKLAALLCQSAEEQSAFYPLFDAFVERLQPAEAPEAPDKQTEEPPSLPPPVPPVEPPPVQKKPEAKKQGQSASDEVKSALSGPITVELQFRDDGYRPWNLPEMEGIVRPLREKEPTGAEEWDLPKTIRQTIQAGGAPRFVKRRRRRSPQYLLLIEQKSVHDHLAGCYADLAAELSRRDLDVAWYFYDRLPNKCWKDRRDPSTYTTIERLAATYGGSRLILIGEPDALLAFGKKKHPKTGQWMPVIHRYPSEFAFRLRDEWPAVALLDTRSTAQWGEAEAAICRLIPVAPANLAGLASLMDQWKNRYAYTPDFWKLESPEPAPPTPALVDLTPANVRAQLKNLKFYLGRHGYSWLCAIAVYPEIYWPLTKILHDEAISTSDVPDESQRSRLWHLFLLRMSRLEWLRYGHIPPEYRQELRQELSNEHAAAVRRQLLEVLQLEENKAPEGTYAYNDRVFTVALLEHEKYVAQERPGPARLSALQEKLRKEVAAVAVSDIEDAVGKNLFRQIPAEPVGGRPVFWVLWVDDTPGNNASYQRKASEENPIEFVNAAGTTEALKALSNQDFQLILSDVSRHGDKEAGIKMMRQFRDRGVTTPVVFFTHPGYVSKHRGMLLELGAAEVVSGFEELRNLVEQYRAAADPLEQGNAALDRAETLEKESIFSEAGPAFEEALALFEQIGDKGKQGDTLQKLGKLYVRMQRYEEARAAFSRALDLFYAVDFGAAQAFVLMDLGRLDKTMQQYEKALVHYSEALDALEGLAGDTDEEQLEVLFELVDIARLMGNAEGALRYVDQGYRKAEGKRKWAFRFALLRGDIYQDTQNHTAALEAYNTAMSLAEGELEQAQVYDQMADAALALLRYDEASSFLSAAKTRYEAIGGHQIELLAIRQKFQDIPGIAKVYEPIIESTRPATEPENAPEDLGNEFIGRKEALEQLKKDLEENPMQGIGGMGKTQLANAFLERQWAGRYTEYESKESKLYFLCSSADREFGEGLKRHLQRSDDNGKWGLLTSYDVVDTPNLDVSAAPVVLDISKADHIFLFLSDAFFQEFGALENALSENKAKLQPILIRRTERSFTFLEDIQTLPAGSRNRYITQFEDREDAYYVLRKNVEEMLKAQTASDPQEETASAPPSVEEVTDFAEENPALVATINKLAVIQNALKMGLSRPILEDLAKALPNNPEARQLLETFDMLEKAKGEGTLSSTTIAYRRRELLKKAQELAAQLPHSEIPKNSPKKKQTKKSPPPPPQASPTDPFADLMVHVKGGTFDMGDTFGGGNENEKPVHRVTLSDFSICKYPVTQGQWQEIMGNNPSSFKGDDLPVENVSWNDCQEFIQKLNAQTGRQYRLPTEAEWEYAARGGISSKGFRYAGSNTLTDVGWFSGNANFTIHPVGQKKANELGLYDMSGNVWEWCADCYEGYPSEAQINPKGPNDGTNRVRRGGSYFHSHNGCHVSERRNDLPRSAGNALGFRLASSSQEFYSIGLA